MDSESYDAEKPVVNINVKYRDGEDSNKVNEYIKGRILVLHTLTKEVDFSQYGAKSALRTKYTRQHAISLSVNKFAHA